MQTVCNKCGQSFEKEYINENHKINIEFEFCSDYDGQTWEFHLCDRCLTQIVEDFIHKPEGFMKYEHQEYWNALEEAQNIENTCSREEMVI